MKKDNSENLLNTLKNEFFRLEPENQLKLLEIITAKGTQEKCKLNDKVLESLETLLEIIRKTEQNKEKLKSLDKFKKLSKVNQQGIINSFIFSCENYSNIEKVERKAKKIQEKIRLCEEKGHNFSKWEEDIGYRKEPVFKFGDPRMGVESYDLIELPCWIRKCSSCKLEEKTFEKPKEVILEEKEKEVADLKKQLEQE